MPVKNNRLKPFQLPQSKFQSLFYWMPVKNNRKEAEPSEDAEVSILVLLDAGQKPRSSAFFVFSESCFNPCFIGCRSKTIFVDANTEKIQEFQSLFYWMPVKNTVDPEVPVTLVHGFNPCFIGCRSKTRRKICPIDSHFMVSILVLLDAGQKRKYRRP